MGRSADRYLTMAQLHRAEPLPKLFSCGNPYSQLCRCCLLPFGLAEGTSYIAFGNLSKPTATNIKFYSAAPLRLYWPRAHSRSLRGESHQYVKLRMEIAA